MCYYCKISLNLASYLSSLACQIHQRFIQKDSFQQAFNFQHKLSFGLESRRQKESKNAPLFFCLFCCFSLARNILPFISDSICLFYSISFCLSLACQMHLLFVVRRVAVANCHSCFFIAAYYICSLFVFSNRTSNVVTLSLALYVDT